MARKSEEAVRCALCGTKDVTDPRGDERYCRACWDKKIAVEDVVAREFTLKRYIRAQSAEKYLVYHSTQKRPIGQLLVLDDNYDLFLTVLLYPAFAWDDEAYHLELAGRTQDVQRPGAVFAAAPGEEDGISTHDCDH